MLDTPLVLLKPPIAVPTAAIFGSPALKRDTKHAIVEDFLAAPLRFGRNDLQTPAESYSSQISQALEIMQNRFGNSRMTGSGSTVFSWMSTDTNSQTPTFQPADLGLNDPAWVGRVSRGLIQHPLLDLLDPIPD